MSDALLARLSGVPAVLGPPDTGDHVRFALTHQVGDQAPVGYMSGETLCGVRVRLDDPVTDGPLTCSTCIRTVGHWWSWRSVCDECGLDSGPWASRWTADVSGLLHITRHHTDSKETL